MRQAVIEAHGIEFAYGENFALRLDELLIARGERVACVGPSGCGKTTLINLISGVLRPDAGWIELDGERISDLGESARRAARLRKIGMVFQEFELLDYLSAIENILLPFRLSGGLRLTREVRERAHELAQSLGISSLLARPPRRLSQGERQRVSVCRSLIMKPVLVIGDEPTGSLDPRNAKAVLDLLISASMAVGASLFVVTHDHSVLSKFDRVIDLSEHAQAVSR
ncbi:MAG: ABC transporter ATP-binding protein [Phycisphaeraceae bacterium]|nr:ABC transporter ATP-binding protein [Phycisphaeraceae bacterium]MCW5763208.1 ABC transporter ATP-binding protein [Phycisphaeraceae bacterium]